MNVKLFAATAALALVTVAPTLADEYPVHRRHHHHYRHSDWPLPYPISYIHNYGPGPVPGTFAFYDGPTSLLCKQSAAAYRGQDGRRYPCF